MNINNLYPSNYLKAADLQGRNVRVVISQLAMEDIGGDHKPVLYFEGHDKGMVLNKTNANNIAAAYTPETDLWVGKEIVLFSTWVDFQGKSVEAIRCRPPQPKDNDTTAPAPRVKEPVSGHLDDEVPFAPDM